MTVQELNTRARMLTLVFTDLAGSTALKSSLGDHAVSNLIRRHREHVQRFAGQYGGRIIDWAGDGCFLTFDTSSAAVLFGLRLQQAHASERDLPGVRVGAHIGEVSETTVAGEVPRIEGLAVDIAARISSLAQPLQVLMSSAVFNSVRQRLRGDEVGAEIVWLAHGAYELKGFDDPLEICEAGIVGVSPLKPPSGSEKAHRAVTPTEEDTLGWRPAVGLNVPRREHWVLEERLGEGGFGEVWLAIHKKTKAKRVFKFCFEPERVRGLKREVVLFRLLKESLGHRDDIAQIVDWEFERAPYFLESEYTEGGDLRDWAERHGGLKNIPLSTRLEIVAQVAVALGAAHSVGVLHKDIKPANILISEVAGKDKPRASLTDFGIGLITDPGALAAQGITAGGLTQTLVRSSSSGSESGAGTRLYMAPELLEGKLGTTLSDIYSLGVVLYQMAIGDLAHGVAPGWERDIEDELLRDDIGSCIDGDPKRRLKSADELATRLRGLSARREELRKRRMGARRRRLLTASSIVGPIVTLLILGFAFQQTRLVGEATRQREAAEAASARAQASAEEAVRQRTEAVALRAEAERGQYVANVRLAATMLDQVNVGSAREILKAAPAAYRGWEWGHFVNRAWPPEDEQETGIPEAPEGKTAAEIWTGATARLVTSLVGHEVPVLSLAFCPDDRRLVTLAGDRTFRVWDIASGKQLLRKPVPSRAWFSTCVLDPAGRLLATPSGERGNELAIWDLETGEVLREFRGHTDLANPTAFSPDSALLVSSGLENTYAVWDVTTGDRMGVLEVPITRATEFSPHAVFVSGSTNILVTFPENRVALWDYRAGRIVRQTQGPRPEVFVSGAIGPSGETVTSWARGLGAAAYWDAATGEEIYSVSYGISGLVRPVVWAPDGTLMLYRSNEFVYMPEGASGFSLTLAFSNRLAAVSTMTGYDPGAFNPRGNLIALPEADGSVRIYAPSQRRVQAEELAQGHADVAFVAQFTHNGEILASAGFDGGVCFSDAHTLGAIREFKAHSEEITNLIFSPDDRYVMTFGYDDFSRIWDVASGDLLFEKRANLRGTLAGGARGPAVRLASHIVGGDPFAPNPARVALTTGTGEISVVSLPSGTVEFVARCDQGWSYRNDFSPDGNFLLNLPYQENFVTLFDGHSGKIVAELRGHTGQLIDHRFSPDGSRIVTTCSDGTARIWDGRTGAPILTLPLAGGGSFTADFSPDGSLLAIGSPNGPAGLFRADSGDKLADLPGHGGFVSGVNFSPDGRRVLTACMDGITRVFSLDGNLVAELRLGEGEQLYHTGWSPDGRSVVTTSSNGSVRVWRAVDWAAFGDAVASEEDFETQLARVRSGR